MNKKYLQSVIWETKEQKCHREKLKQLYEMDIHEQIEIENHFILRVPNGWIYTDRRADQAPSGVFVPE